ncbi:hypothetical protein B566_EDAN001599 [Ephemera danica]|nr:hypothetical protein B566_EDAN001599 [Ephemera danica]
MVKHQVDSVVKSAEDKRLYRGLQLNNDLKVMLISDPSTDKAAAALDVNIGYLSDPEELPGLAHFCEHMLFLGTQKYPCENEYSKFLSEHGGSCNACTGADHTNYFFDVVPEHLAGALDRFSQFFLTPLFTESATEREVCAVDSEHCKNIPNDAWRLHQLEQSTSKPDHPYSKFGTGNRKTLETDPKSKGINPREQLLKFHDTWYSSNIMSLSILGKEDLDTLQSMAEELFSGVCNKQVVAPEWPDHPFGPEQLRLRGLVVPVKDLRSLNLTFPIPDLRKQYKTAPERYLSHLLGHEAPGSLLSALKTRGWSSHLEAGARTGAKGFGFFSVTVDLTEEGVNHTDDIVDLVFQYINMLKKEGPKEWIFREYSNIMAMHFRFKDKEVPRNYVYSVVSNMQVCSLNMRTILWMRVGIMSQQFETEADKVEPWYGTKYKMAAIEPDTLQRWEKTEPCEELKLPSPNEFLPTDFSLFPREENAPAYPTIISDSSLCRVWFKQDDEFLLPKANLCFEFVSPMAYLDPLRTNLLYLFELLVKDALIEYAYDAELAGMKWEFYSTKYGLIYERGLKNFKAEQPYQHGMYYEAVLLAEQAWTKDELLEHTRFMTVEKLAEYIPQLLSSVHVECLIHGNVDKEKALQLAAVVESKITTGITVPLLPPHLLRSRELQLSEGYSYIYKVTNETHSSSCAEVYLQCPLQSTSSNILLELFVQLTSEPCFNTLRTQEQLGYIVVMGVRRGHCAQGLRIIVQSLRHPVYVVERIEKFLFSLEEYLEKMGTEEFERHKQALAAQRLEKPKKLSARTARYWSEINSQQYNFERDIIEVAYLRGVTKADVIAFFKDVVMPTSAKRHKLAVHVVSMAPGGAGLEENSDTPQISAPEEASDSIKACVIDDIASFKSSQAYFPMVQPSMKIRPKGARAKL